MEKHIGVAALLACAVFAVCEKDILEAIAWAFAAFMYYMCQLNAEGWARANASHAETNATLAEAAIVLRDANDIIKKYQDILGTE